MTAAKLAFIVRPFGTKDNIDFDRVERELIKPALAAVGGEGDTTGIIASAGNIRKDMFELIATRELVIADISIHNANVFYELGVRHALRGKRTFLIKAKTDKDVPFDLKTDRYLEYSCENPAAALPALIEGLRQTLDSDDIDSPVLDLLQLNQGIIPADLARLLTPPEDFREEVTRASKQARVGDLALLSEEAGMLGWEREGLRIVGAEQSKHSSWEAARKTWERVRGFNAKDLEANIRLATVFQKVKDYQRSEEAIERVFASEDVRGPARAELGALLGSNAKTLWEEEWKRIDDQVERERIALKSPRLCESFEAYAGAFAEDRNHFYSAVNALALLAIRLELGTRYPDIWATFEDDDEPGALRRKLERMRGDFMTGVKLGMESAQRMAEFTRTRDRWLELSKGDLEFAKGGSADRVSQAYTNALTGAERFFIDSAHRQISIFARLSVFRDNATAVLKVLDAFYAKLPAGKPGPVRVLVFTGHRIDAANRAQPRFPRTEKAESMARQWIAGAVREECKLAGKDATVIGLSGGASGGDILFHEVCEEQGIETEMFIVHSDDAFKAASVQDAGPEWVSRYDALRKKRPVRYLGDSDKPLEHPRWLRSVEKKYSIWQRNNRWMLHNALVYGGSNVTLIALWNGAGGDGPGGTEDMVTTVRASGAKVVVLDAKPLSERLGNTQDTP